MKHTYPDRTVVGLCGLNLAAHASERVAIIGPNGSGKTTLLLHVMDILKPLEGELGCSGWIPTAASTRSAAGWGWFCRMSRPSWWGRLTLSTSLWACAPSGLPAQRRALRERT
ncbi:MAG: ATP-binding cassette domain-containing protein [Bacillota bacterium]